MNGYFLQCQKNWSGLARGLSHRVKLCRFAWTISIVSSDIPSPTSKSLVVERVPPAATLLRCRTRGVLCVLSQISFWPKNTAFHIQNRSKENPIFWFVKLDRHIMSAGTRYQVVWVPKLKIPQISAKLSQFRTPGAPRFGLSTNSSQSRLSFNYAVGS